MVFITTHIKTQQTRKEVKDDRGMKLRTTNQIRQLVFNSGSVKVTARPAEEMERADWAGLREGVAATSGAVLQDSLAVVATQGEMR